MALALAPCSARFSCNGSSVDRDSLERGVTAAGLAAIDDGRFVYLHANASRAFGTFYYEKPPRIDPAAKGQKDGGYSNQQIRHQLAFAKKAKRRCRQHEKADAG